MAEAKEGKAAQWTDAEKLSILFQIIDKGGSIPYDDLVLPEGRTKKAVQLMIARERTKAKDALGTSATDGEQAVKATAPKNGKRKAKDQADGAPKTKASRKKKAATVTAGADVDEAT